MKRIQIIQEILRRNKVTLRRKYNVRNIAIFGSLVRGDQRGGSDIDLLVEFESPVGMFAFMDLEEHLEDLLGSKIDLVTRKALKPNIGRSILKEIVPV